MKIQFKKSGIGNEWLYNIADEINRTFNSHVIVENNQIIFPPDIAEGSCKYYKLSNDVDICITDVVYNVRMIYERVATTEDPYYSMHLNCSPSSVEHFSQGKRNKMGGTANSSIYWSSSAIPVSFKTEPGEKFQSIFICVSKEYIQNTLWNADSPSHPCGLRDNTSQGCTLETNTECHCKADAKDICNAFNDSEIIKSNIYTALGTVKYNLVQEIINMDKGDSVSEKIIIKGNVLKILAHFIQKITSEKYKKSKGIMFGDAAKIMQIKKTIDDGAHFQHFSLNDLAKLVGISKTKLKIKFKEIVGTSVYQYYLDVRMRRAKDMLYNNPRSITNLAYEMGFKTVSHFSQMYKKYYGINPNSIIVQSRRTFNS
ncbi:helix-turn-helix domain-containing protein [Pinibacter aurantiacus]|uniref:Helix-turn-helix transcriptional regulator n=1 Tax=Pinibacter aurantiacus TaxID=2851599 RepID=A0A9E2W4L0_9BACT|nr:helix-turn-helix transcriptional regulator [Pinibacter aurantiacus]MBV4359895.1 helix-turn-helix transcriptional regulator [Pinibacter aurantiacus]